MDDDLFRARAGSDDSGEVAAEEARSARPMAVAYAPAPAVAEAEDAYKPPNSEHWTSLHISPPSTNAREVARSRFGGIAYGGVRAIPAHAFTADPPDGMTHTQYARGTVYDVIHYRESGASLADRSQITVQAIAALRAAISGGESALVHNLTEDTDTENEEAVKFKAFLKLHGAREGENALAFLARLDKEDGEAKAEAEAETEAKAKTAAEGADQLIVRYNPKPSLKGRGFLRTLFGGTTDLKFGLSPIEMKKGLDGDNAAAIAKSVIRVSAMGYKEFKAAFTRAGGRDLAKQRGIKNAKDFEAYKVRLRRDAGHLFSHLARNPTRADRTSRWKFLSAAPMRRLDTFLADSRNGVADYVGAAMDLGGRAGDKATRRKAFHKFFMSGTAWGSGDITFKRRLDASDKVKDLDATRAGVPVGYAHSGMPYDRGRGFRSSSGSTGTSGSGSSAYTTDSSGSGSASTASASSAARRRAELEAAERGEGGDSGQV